MEDKQDDLEFQKVLDSGISEMTNVPYSTNYDEAPNSSNINNQQETSSSIFSIIPSTSNFASNTVES